MKKLKTLFVILTLFPFLSYGQTSNYSTVSSLLNYINTEVGKYNKYEAYFDVDQKSLVFANKFGVAKIPFSEIDFRMDRKSFSIDVYCLAENKCIKMYNNEGDLSSWNYYNVSMPHNGGMAESGQIVFAKFKELKKIIATQNVVAADASTVILRYINSQFSKYNKYDTHFDVDRVRNQLIFTNQFGTANIPFSDIDFKLNAKTKSIDVYCLDGEKCIKKYDDNNELTTWNYYNVSLQDGDEMANEIYTVLENCKKLKTYFSNIVDEGESIDEILVYVNSEIGKYNKYGSRISVDGDNLIFMNEFGRSDIPFRWIDFRMNYEHNSIDIYCIDESKCIKKYDDNGELTTWNYYNISMLMEGGIAPTAKVVLEKCKSLKKRVLR